MKQLLGFLLAPVLLLPQVAAADPTITAFAGTVLRSVGDTRVYRVTLYRGDSSADPNFNTTKVLITSTDTDTDGHFVLLAPDLTGSEAVTIRAKNAALGVGNDAVPPKPANGSWPDLTSGITITPITQKDPNFGIRNNNYARATMFFVTDRMQSETDFANTASATNTPTFGSFIGHVALGNGQAIPGHCGLAADWECAGRPILNDDGFIDSISTMASGDAAHAALRLAIAAPRGNTILLFVHGYNTSFDQGAEKATRLSYLMEPDPHTTIVYSWPSAARVKGYPQDAKSSDLSAKANLVWVLDALANAPNHSRIVLAGHSMGAYTLTTALYLWAISHPSSKSVFSDLVLFAGDLDISLWAIYQADVGRVVRRIKFYGNVNDQALHISTCTTGDSRPRVGQVPTWTAPVVGFDATKFASTDDYGHGYVTSSTSVAADWNQWIDTTPTPNLLPTLRRTGWLGDGGGSLINSGKISATVICGIWSRLPF